MRGEDGFALSGTSSMAEISRDVTDLAAQTIGPNHQYPDGVLLFTGTMFAPIQDRDHPGQGFTHKVGDLVEIACPELGALVNRVNHCDQIAPWTFGTGALMRNLARNGTCCSCGRRPHLQTGPRPQSGGPSEMAVELVQPARDRDVLLGAVQAGHLVFDSEFFTLEAAEDRLIGQRAVHFVVNLSLEMGMLAT